MGNSSILQSHGTADGTQPAKTTENGTAAGGLGSQDTSAEPTVIPATTPGDTVTKPTKPPEEPRLAILADLLADLPEADRREVTADLTPAQRVALAKLLLKR